MNHGKSNSEETQGDVSPGYAHDSACPCWGQCVRCVDPDCICACFGIALGRADERERIAAMLESVAQDFPEGDFAHTPRFVLTMAARAVRNTP